MPKEEKNKEFFLFHFFRLVFARRRHQIEKTKPRFLSIALSLFLAYRPLERRKRVFSFPSAKLQKRNSKKPPLSRRSIEALKH